MSDDIASVSEDELLGLLRKTFIDEATTFLAESEAALVSLETPAMREQALAEIFRAYHSVKGSAASVGFHDMAQLGHVAEDCLSVLRAQPGLVTCDIVSLLLEVNDALRTRLETLFQPSDDIPAWNGQDLQLRLKDLISSLATPSATPVADVKPQAAMGFFDEAEAPKAPETAMKVEAPTKASTTTLAFKIDAAKVDAVMDMVGELVVIKSQLIETLHDAQNSDGRTKSVISLLDKSVRELHEKTLAMRMLSLKNCFLKIQRMARDLSQKLEKPIDFTMSGEDTELDRALIEQISDPLMHLCRNAIDHGIEAADERRRLGKPPAGKVSLRAFRRGEGVLIEITDDGAGIVKKRVLQQAIAKGLVAPDLQADLLSAAQIHELLFLPGFSTAPAVTDISGRGVGLDVVRSNIAGIKGRVEVESTEGAGSCFRMMIPLTTAITDGIIVDLQGQKYVVPVECVRSFVEAKQAAILDLAEGKTAVAIGGKHYPLLSVPGIVPTKSLDAVLFLLVDVLDKTVALAVDQVHGKAQVVLKSLRGSVDKSGYFSGAAVMGDGKVALVLDVIGLCNASALALTQGSIAA